VQGDRFLLCSDGLVDEVLDDTIGELLDRIADPFEAATELVATANRHGGRDNVTVLIVDVLEGVIAADPTLELELEPHWADGEGEIENWSDDATPTAPWGQPAPDATSDSTPTSAGPVTDLDERDITRTMALPVIPRRGEPVDDRPVATSRRATRSHAVTGQPAAQSAAATTGADIAESGTTGSQADADRDSDTSADTTPGDDAKLPANQASAGWDPLDERRGVSWRTIGFLIGIAAVAVAAFVANARSGYYVDFAGDKVAIYKGHEGGMLWFDPTLSEAEGPTRAELAAPELAAIAAKPTFESLGEARVFVGNLPSTPPTTTPPTSTTAAVTTTANPAPASSVVDPAAPPPAPDAPPASPPPTPALATTTP
jgi:PPM family protein phosphatase